MVRIIIVAKISPRIYFNSKSCFYPLISNKEGGMYGNIAQNAPFKIVETATKGTKRKKVKKSLKKGLTKGDESGIIYKLSRRAVSESEQRGH